MNLQIHGKNKMIWGLPGSAVSLLFREKPQRAKSGVGFLSLHNNRSKTKMHNYEQNKNQPHSSWKVENDTAWSNWQKGKNKQTKRTQGNVCVNHGHNPYPSKSLQLIPINSIYYTIRKQTQIILGQTVHIVVTMIYSACSLEAYS